MKRIYFSKYGFRKLLFDLSLNEFRDKNKHPLQEPPPNYIWRTTDSVSWAEKKKESTVMYSLLLIYLYLL
jgi:hypothetical protein